MPLTIEQYRTLRKPLNPTRVAKRSQGGKTLTYLESWDVRAHLSRVFGYTAWDEEILDCYQVGVREYTTKDGKAMAEPIWFARVQLTVRDTDGQQMCRYTESAVGSSAAPDYLLAESHDNAVKTAASDALKRCAINLGTQFGLSLYDDGSMRDVVKGTIVGPDGFDVKPEGADLSADQAAALSHSLGREDDSESPTQAPETAPEPEPVS